MNYIFHQHIKNPNSSKLVLYLATLLFNINDRLPKVTKSNPSVGNLLNVNYFLLMATVSTLEIVVRI